MGAARTGGILSLGLLCAAGCAANTSGSVLTTCEQLAAMQPPVTPKVKGTVFTIVMENHSRDQIIGNEHAPYITSLAKKYAEARGYHDAYVHPSEANYLWMVSGENFHVLDDDDPIAHHIDSTSHIADQLEAAGLTWKAYEESMGAPCGLKSKGRYAAKHDPFVFFNDVNGWDGTDFHPEKRCNQHVVDYSQLATDIAADTVPDYVFITPNLDDDMHDGSVEDGDDWLRREIPKIMASDAYKKGGVIFLLADEGGGTPASDDPPFIVISDHVKPSFVSHIDYDTSSYLKTVESLTGIAELPCDSNRSSVAAMNDLFVPEALSPPA